MNTSPFEPGLWLQPDVTCDLMSSDLASFHIGDYVHLFPDLTPPLYQAFCRLVEGAITRTELRQRIAATGTVNDVLRLEREVNMMLNVGWLVDGVAAKGQLLASRVRLSSSLRQRPYNELARYVPSRFAFLHCVNGQMIVESPLAHALIRFHDWRGAALFSDLQQNALPSIPGLSETTTRVLIRLLAETGLLDKVEDDGRTTEDHNTVLRQWDFHDLLFHARSRIGRNTTPVGATYRFRGEIDHLPVIKPPMTDFIVPLIAPDLNQLAVTDPSFTWVMENRRSQRSGDKPLTVTHLGELLYRTARLKVAFDNQEYQASQRPCPSGGAMHEIELYFAIERCGGIEDGFYHYCPDRHVLERLSGSTVYSRGLTEAAQASMGASVRPRVVIIMAARFQRLAWKYEGIAYALSLKHIGVFQQTFYLAATAMGISGCAIGTGNSDNFCAAAGTDYYAESSIGEFVLP